MRIWHAKPCLTKHKQNRDLTNLKLPYKRSHRVYHRKSSSQLGEKSLPANIAVRVGTLPTSCTYIRQE